MKANMAKERLEITKQLAGERERELNLNETMTVLKHQADLYIKQICTKYVSYTGFKTINHNLQAEMLELQKGGLEKAKTFQFFKTQIEKLNHQMVELEQQTEEWRENSEVRREQLQYLDPIFLSSMFIKVMLAKGLYIHN